VSECVCVCVCVNAGVRACVRVCGNQHPQRHNLAAVCVCDWLLCLCHNVLAQMIERPRILAYIRAFTQSHAYAFGNRGIFGGAPRVETGGALHE
jgi:hypothetical protein